MVISLGIPLDENSSFLRGPALAPQKIREAFKSDSSNYFSESGLDLNDHPNWTDIGDIKLSTMPESFNEIDHAISEQLIQDNKLLVLGGDHSITYPIVKAVSRKHKHLNILHIDAHADLYDELDGKKYSHACPFARIMEEELAVRLVQVGIRTLNKHQREQADRFGVEVYEMKDWSDDIKLKFDGPVYLSLDMDALDPAFAPGVSHYEPGGFSTRQILNIIQKFKGQLVGADIVELNPSQDINGMTAMVAAKFFKEILDRMLLDVRH